MESLLRWSIENSTPAADGSAAPQPPRKDLDPAIIDMILGKSDAELMKEDMSVAMDEQRSEDDRLAALDHLEMLVEQIDNANNLEKLQMWKPLHSLLTADHSTDPIIMQALWVIGTALQNNPAAQDSYSALGPLPVLTSFLTPSASTPQIRSKLIYTLSGLLKHNAPTLEHMDDPEVDGWTKLRDALQDPDITVRRKVAFLLNTLLTPTASLESPDAPPDPAVPVHANSHASNLRNPSRTSTSPLALDAMRKHGIVSALVQGLANPLPYGEDGDIDEADADFEEKGVAALRTYATECKGSFEAEDKATLKDWFKKEKDREGGGGETGLAERWGLGGSDLKELVASVE